MAEAPTPRRRTSSSSSRRSFSQRMTAKVGPLPVWAWALAILAVGYLIYRHSSSSSSTTDTQASDTSSGDVTAPTTDTSTSGTPGPDQTGTDSGTGGLNDELLSQLSGFQGSLDSLTAAVLSSPAFLPGSGDAGSGSQVPNGVPAGTVPASAPSPPTVATGAHGGTATAPHAAATTKPAPTLVSEHGAGSGFTATRSTRYYTYAPGKAPKGQKGNEAPAAGPRGTTLHFAAGRGYYYA